MTLLRRLIRTLDRPGGRTILATLATSYARKKIGWDVRILYDAAWLHGLNGDYVVDSDRFDYYTATILSWRKAYLDIFAGARDYWCHLYSPQPGDVIVDVGAGVGWDTMAFSRAVGERGQVLAVEAHPTTFRLLQAQCKWARLANVRACQVAVMDGRCAVYIDDFLDHEGNSVSPEAGAGRRLGNVPGISMDELCAAEGIVRIDLLKMNIEGAERFAIHGMKETIRHTRHICIACHDFRSDKGGSFSTKALVVDYLRGHGFEITVRAQDLRPYVRDHVHGVRRR